jgi:hypothetical protein
MECDRNDLDSGNLSTFSLDASVRLAPLSTHNAKATLIPAGGSAMTGRGRPTAIAKAFVANFLIFALSVGALRAADLPPPAPASPAPEAAPRWYVKLGVVGALDHSWSSLFAQQVAEVLVPGVGMVPVTGFGPQVSLVGRGATYSNVFSASFVGGYFAGGIPLC